MPVTLGQSARGTQKDWVGDHLWYRSGVPLGFFIIRANNNSQFHATTIKLIDTYAKKKLEA